MNEPFSPSYLMADHQEFDTELECFYTGRANPGLSAVTHLPISCPADDPAEGVIPTIEANDPNHLVFFEPDVFTVRGATNFIGAMDLPRLVFNFHSYCPQRSGITGDPIDIFACANHVLRAVGRR